MRDYGDIDLVAAGYQDPPCTCKSAEDFCDTCEALARMREEEEEETE